MYPQNPLSLVTHFQSTAFSSTLNGLGFLSSRLLGVLFPRDKRSWDLLQEGWDEYNSNTGWSEQWVDHELATVSNEEEDREEEELKLGHRVMSSMS